ncbi:hypothetical protein ACKFKG_17085 [Phormidesmis sp. 146-35]
MTNITQKNFKAHQITIAVLTGLILLTGAKSQQAGLASQPSNTVLSNTVPSKIRMTRSPALPSSVEQRVRQDLSQRLNIPLRDVKIVSFSQQTWSDSCLGLGGAAEGCLRGTVQGWRVEVTNGQQNWFYRTDDTAQATRLEPQPNNVVTLPADVAQRLLKTVARQVSIPISRLQIAEVKSATWDGCLGVYKPEQACTQIALSGWQVIVTSDDPLRATRSDPLRVTRRDRSWVYHLDESANRIAQNPTASRSQGGLVPSFIPEQNKPEIETNVVFRSIVSGDLTGKVTQVTLTNDGVITQLITAPNIRSRPVVLGRLSSQQVEQFQQILQTQRFRNLNDLRYLSSAAFADYPTTTLQGVGSTVQYIDLEVKNLPKALQSVIQAWEKLPSR